MNTPSPEDLHAKLEHMLRDAGCSNGEFVQVASAPVGGHARYIVNVMPGKPRLALANTLERILHRPFLGAYWVLCLDEVRAVTAAPEVKIR